MFVFIRGAGDLATGISARLYRAGIQVCHSELAIPTAVRRNVAFSEAVRLGKTEVEGINAVLARTPEEVWAAIKEKKIPVVIDSGKEMLKRLKPDAVVDAILAKHNLGTEITDAKVVIGVGPGFTAGKDCHAVVETKRGHNLGRVILNGSAIPNTGVPGNIGGFTKERVLWSPAEGIFEPVAKIGDVVKRGDIVAMVSGIPVKATIDGVLRGLLQEGVPVTKGMKSGDIDPRCKVGHCFSASDKARAIGGGVLEALCHFTERLDG